MSDYLPPDELTLEGAAEALLSNLPIREGGAHQVDRTFFDTFDGLLHAAGVSAVHENGHLALVERESGAERARLQIAQPVAPLLAQDLAPGPLRDALAPIIDVRALLPLVHVHSRLLALSVIDDERKTIARVTLEEPALISASGRETMLRPRVRVAGVRGYDKELAGVQGRLEQDLRYVAADQPLVDEAVRASGGAPGGTSSKINVPLRGEERADAAATAVLWRLLEVIDANFEGTIADVDSEFLHDFRVAIRRSRSVQRELRNVFPPEELAHFRAEFRWLQQVTGDSRDLDVYVLEFDDYRAMVPELMRSDLDPMLAVLRGRRLGARREMVRALRSERTTRVLHEWAAFLKEFVSRPVEDRPDAARPIAQVAGERITKVFKRIVRMGGAIDSSSPSEDYHELRKKGKELRYLLELFGAPLYPAVVVKPMIKSLKALQDVLGRHQDREIQSAMVRALAGEVSALPGGAEALMAMGVLVERLAQDQQAARNEFADTFGEFASGSQRKLVKDTFG